MHLDDDQLADEGIMAKRSSLRCGTHWLWNPWYAKLFLALSGLYWLGLYAVMLEPDLFSNSIAGGMILLVLLFNPITVVAILGWRWGKAIVAHSDWIVLPGATREDADRQRREQEAAYLNPVDIRSGYLHQQYMDRARRHPIGRDDP